jgi:hypothetical protein
LSIVFIAFSRRFGGAGDKLDFVIGVTGTVLRKEMSLHLLDSV